MQTPPFLDFQPSSQSNHNAARSCLVQQRIVEPGYRPAESQTRHKFRSKQRKEAVYNEEQWIFTKHEVAKAFNTLLFAENLVAPGVACSMLSQVSLTSLEELWSHLHDPKLEKRMKRLFGRRSSSAIIPPITWLDQVTERDNIDYVHLLCQAGVAQEALDRALRIAIRKHSVDMISRLLSFGASGSACSDLIQEYVRLNDVSLINILLSAPNAMSTDAWRFCMEPEVESLPLHVRRTTEILLSCIAHRPDVVSGALLLRAVESENLRATSILLAYATFDEVFIQYRQPACELATRIHDDFLRYRFFRILEGIEWISDSPVLREELMKDIKLHHLPLVGLLVDAKVILDVEPYNALNWAVSNLDFDILELFVKGTFTSPLTLALNNVPDATAEPDMLRLLGIMGPMGLAGKPLDIHLVRAVRKQQSELVAMLLQCGASVEFEQASAVQTALGKSDLDTLNLLLGSHCSPKILSAAIPATMGLQSRNSRLRAMEALVKKGIINEHLAAPLLKVVSEDGSTDIELLRFLLQNQAPVDGTGNGTDSSVFVAVRRGNLPVLKMLCDAGSGIHVLSKAVPLAFHSMPTCGYSVVRDMISVLLVKGASGQPVHETLQSAAKLDNQLNIVRLLLKHNAEPNYANGDAFCTAVKTANLKLLEILCDGCPPSQATLELVIPIATEPRYYNLGGLKILLGSTPSAAAALNTCWNSDRFKGNPHMTDVLPCFLQYGLDVNLRGGVILCFAIQERNLGLLSKILTKRPAMASLKAAFQDSMKVRNRVVQITAMRLLLGAAGSGDIGQSKLLLQETRNALSGDSSCLELLLLHKADVDSNQGEAIQAAASEGSLRVLHLLLQCNPSPSTIYKAILASASSSINSEQKTEILDYLLSAGGPTLKQDTSKLLLESVSKVPSCKELPKLLLERGAEVSPEVIQVAIKTASREMFEMLMNNISNANIIAKLFTYASKSNIEIGRRYWVYQCFLRRGVPPKDISEALLNAMKAGDLGDLSVVKLLLERGALVSHNDGAVFASAFHSGSLQAVKLLGQYLSDNRTAGIAFDLARKSDWLNPPARVETYRSLLHWGIAKSSIQAALEENLNSRQSDLAVVQLLLSNGADANKDKAKCLVIAAKKKAKPEFCALSKKASMLVVFKALCK
jgi:hypothetical protein